MRSRAGQAPGGDLRVLLSHSVAPEAKRTELAQIVERLGGAVIADVADCTHFVAERFGRTINMLTAMACGRPVVTPAWLRACRWGSQVAPWQPHVLRDRGKEAAFHFSLADSLAAAQREPLFEGWHFWVGAGLSPPKEALEAVVRAAGGQVHGSWQDLSRGGSPMARCAVIAAADDAGGWQQLLGRGLKHLTAEGFMNAILQQQTTTSA